MSEEEWDELMAEQSPPAVTAAPRLADVTVDFIGQPPTLNASVAFVNECDEKAKVPHLELAGFEIATPGRVKVMGRLQPQECRSLNAAVTVQAETPAGDYAGTVRCGGEELSAVLHVLERFDVDVMPDEITLQASGGDKVTAKLALLNRGNVDYTLPKATRIHLEEDDWVGRSAVAALKCDEPAGFDDFMNKLTGAVHARQVSPATVRIHAGEHRIAAGTTAIVELEIQLPELGQHSSFHGPMKLGRLEIPVAVDTWVS